MLRSRALLASLFAVPFVASARPLPSPPLGFEKTPDGYVAHQMGGTMQVRSTGAEILGPGRQIRMNLVGAGANPKLEGTGDAGTLNEIIGNDPAKWRSGIELNENVTARGVYPGVDIVWYGRDSTLEYDFNVQPHADPGNIRIRISGAERVELTGSGDVLITDSQGTITQKLPAAYQTLRGMRRQVTARFRIEANATLSFELGPYDHSAPLTIDPALQLSSYLGGVAADEGHAVAVDSSGNFYIAGLTYSTTIGNSNVLLLKIPASGSPVRLVYGGSLGNDFANAITTDSSGNVYVVGATTSTDFPIVGPLAFQSVSVFGLQKAFVVALGSALTPSVVGYSAWFGGSATDEAYGIALGPDNYLYIVGDTTSIDFLNSTDDGALINSSNNSVFQYSNHGGYDGFLLSMTTAGLFNFATYIGGTSDDHAYGVAVDSNSYIYVVGETESTDFPSHPDSTAESSMFQTYQGGGDAFAIKLEWSISSNIVSSAGIWSIFLGGSSEDIANAVALDSSGNPYVTGVTASNNFPVSGSGFQATYQGGETDGFIIALNADGLTGFWGSYVGSSGDDILNSIALDSAGNIYVTGTTDGTTYPVTSTALQSTNGGGQDVVVTELNNSGSSVLYSTYMGGSGNDIGRGITVGSNGNIYLAGITGSLNFPVTSGSYETTYGGGASDAFFAILGCSTGTPTIAAGGIGNAASYSTTALSPGGIFAIFGSYFSCTPTTSSTLPLPTTLNGVTVEVNGTAVPLFYAGEGQINAQIPYGTPAGNATITVTSSGGTSEAGTLPVEAAGPGIFMIGTQAAAVNADGTVNTTANPAHAGSYISVYFTGTGPLSNPPASGAVASSSPLSQATLPYSATIDGSPAVVPFLGLAPGFVGLGQANITIPAGLAPGNYPLIITIGGVASNSAVISVTN
jgi:uncharacterized protein (TIGR03437 family)